MGISTEGKSILILQLCYVRLLFKLSYDEQACEADFWMHDYWEWASRCLGLKPLTFPEQGSLSASHCINRRGHLHPLSSLDTDLNPNPIKWRQEEQSPYSFGFTSQSLHPKPEEMGKWSFQLILMGSPGPLGLRGPQSSDIHCSSCCSVALRCHETGWTTGSLHVQTAIASLRVMSHFLQWQLFNPRWNRSNRLQKYF